MYKNTQTQTYEYRIDRINNWQNFEEEIEFNNKNNNKLILD